MATPVGQLTIEMAANIVRLQKDMDAARKTVDGAMASIGKSVENAMRTIGGLFAGVSIGAFAGKLVAVEREFGTLNASLVTVTGSAMAADKAFALLTNFAATTPFSLQEVTAAFIKMKAMGLDASEGALRSYGNTASAMGKSLNQMIEAVADAATGEFERLKEFGIRAKSEGDRVTLTFRGVSTNIGKNAAEIEAYLRRIGDVDFAGAMDARAKTLDGAISNLGDSWDALFRTINSEMTGPLLMTAVQGAQTAIVGLSNVVKNFTDFMEQNKVALMAFAAILAGPAIVSGIGAATAAFVAMRAAVVGLTLAFASNPIALAILAITAAAVPAIDGIQRYMNANAALEKEQAGLNQTQAETERLLRQAEPVKAKAAVSTRVITEAEKERAKELKKQEDAYTKLLNDIEDKTGAMLLEQQQTEKLTDSQKLALKVMQDIQSGTLKLNDAQKIKITQSLEDLLNTERLNAEMKDLAKTQQAAIALSDKLNEEQYKNTESLRANVVSLMEQNDELRLGKDAVIARQVAVMRSTATDLEFAAATYEGNEQLMEQARLLRQQADLVEDNAMLTAAKETTKEWEKTSDTIGDSLTDALMRGFESGKGFGQNLIDTLKNMFSTLILRPIIEPIAKGASNVILSLMGMGASGAASAGGLSSAITLGGVGLSAIGQSIATGFMTTIGGGSVTAAASAYSAAGMGGVSAGLTAGQMAATAMPYVAAALVAANALGLMRSNRTVGGGVTGTLGGTLQEYDLNRRGGSLFSGPDYSIANMRVTETTEGINAAFTAMRDKSLAAAHALGSYNTGLETFTYTLSERLHPDLNELGLVLDGLTAEQKQEKIRGVLMAAEEAMAAIIVGSTGLQLAGETAVQALNRLMSIQTASDMLNQFGGAFSAFATSSIAARQNIIELAGGLDQLVQKTQGFIANFYTREEQAGITARGVVQALEAAGFTAAQIASLETRADFRTLLESIDVSTDIGQQQFVALLDLQAQYANTSVLMEEQGKTLLAIADAAPQIEMLQRMLETDAEYQTRVQTAEEMAQATFDGLLETMGKVDISINNLSAIMATRLDRLAVDMANAQAEANAAAANAIAVANASAAAAIEAAAAADRAEAAAMAQYQAQFDGAAMGGFIDGPTLVGEHGPEIFNPRTSQIYTAPATTNMFGGNELAGEMRALRDEVAMMRYETRSTAVNTAKIARLQDNWDVRGLTVRTDADQPLDTVTV
jgi:hypothetical protein